MSRRIVAGVLACLASLAGAQPVALHIGADEPIRLDGHLDEPAWTRAAEFDGFVQYRPVNGAPPPDGYRTTVRVLAADDALLIGIEATDPRPHEIRAPLVRRDKVLRDQDFVAVVLDGAGTRRSAQFVRVNAAGVIADGLYRYDGDVEDFAPDFDVEAAVTRLPDGYSVELRLPLLSLRYPFAGEQAWRLMVTRVIPREENVLLLSAPLSRDAPAFIAEMEPLLGMREVIAAAQERSLLTVRPEITWRRARDSAAGVPSRSDSQLSVGAEIKWRPRADWVIDATINPDFSQVELDAPQLAGNTRFALSVPEKRAFFLESTDLLDLPLPAFYSRSITDPQWGLRATWRGADRDASALVMIDDGGGVILRPAAYGTRVLPQDAPAKVAVARGRWHGEAMTFGAMTALRDGDDGRRNGVVGIDLFTSGEGADEWRARVMASDTDDRAVGGRHDSGSYGELTWARLTSDWRFEANATRISPRFRNDNGFVDQAGVQVLEGEMVRRLGERDLGWFTADEFDLYLWGQHVGTLADARPEEGDPVPGHQTVSRSLKPGIWWAGERASEGWAELQWQAERARPTGPLLATPRIAAGYSLNPAAWAPRINVELAWGRWLDVDADRVGSGARWLVESRLRGALGGIGLESEQSVEQTFIRGPEGRRAIVETGWQWLGVMHLNAQDSLRLVWQGQDVDRRADPGAALAAASWRQRTVSLVFQHRVGIRTHISVGATRERSEPGTQHSSEVFAKAAMAF